MSFAAYNSEHSKAIISVNDKMIVHNMGLFGSWQIQAMLPHLEIEAHSEAPQIAPTDLMH